MDKIPAGEIKDKSKFLRWLDNFWYHYKIHIIIIIFVAIVVIAGGVQICRNSNNSQDVTVLYAGPYLMNGDEREGVRSALNAAIPEDFNQDGKKYTEMITYQILSEEQMKAMAAETGEDGENKYTVNRSYYTKEYENYSNTLLTGEFAVCMLDPWLYESLANSERLKKLTDVFDEVPHSAVGEYGVRLSDTDFYKYFDALKVLPEDTVICLLCPYVFGEISKPEFYSKSVSMYKNMVNFQIP